METAIRVLVVLLFVHQIVGPPVTTKNTNESQDENQANATAQLADMGIEYNRYLSQVVEALESDPEFKKKLETAEEADIRSGKIAKELELVHHKVRTKLDELKRTELSRLRHLALLRAAEAENDVDPKHLKVPEHVDHSNPHSFEIVDLHKLITKVTHDLAVADEMRRMDFKEYEMQKEFEKQEKLKQLDEEHRKEYLHTIEEQKTLHDKHPTIHHPGSKPQLKEVWEKQDHMETQDFNPKAFFYMHDLDGNGVWDQDEVKTLFLKELDKMYQAGAPEDDMRERAEEMERMREHVFGEMDVDKDNLISLQEFLQQTKNPEFERDPGWETVDHQQVYTPEEYAEFERRRQEEIDRLIAEGKLQRLPPPPPHGMQPPVHNNAQVPQYQGQPQYQQGQNPPYNVQQGQPQAQQAQYQPQQGQYQAQQQAYQGQQYQSNNIPQQQPQSNYNIPHQQQPPSNIQQQQQPPSNIPHQQQPPSNIQQQQQPPSNIPQQQQQPESNNIPQAPVQSNYIPQSQQNQKNPPPPQPPSNVAAK